MANSKGLGVRGIQNVKSYPVASGAAFNAGDFVYWTSSGVTGPPAAGSNYAPQTNFILGRALHGATDTIMGTYSHVDVIVAEPGTQFEMPLYHSTASSAVPTLANLGSKFEMKQTTGGWPAVDLTSTTNNAVRIMDFNPNDYPAWPNTLSSGTTQYALCWVEFLATICAFTGARTA